MRSGWIALILLLTYLVIVFIAFRILDVIQFCHHGLSSTTVVDPFILSVRQLKQLLEVRGVSYTGYVEKRELAELVKESADVRLEELEELSHDIEDKDKLANTPDPSKFTSATHFYEEVEDTKDSVWIVHVTGKDSLLDDYTWKVVRKKVAPFAIRTGVFNCNLDPRLCQRKGWKEPLLLLAMPRGSKPKDQVILRTCHYTRPQAIIEWLSEELSVRVKKVSNFREVEKEWLNNSQNNNSSSISSASNLAVKVLLFTHLLHPPLFLAALSIKFTGRINFGIFSVLKDDEKVGRLPIYLIVTPEKTTVYGLKKKEHYNLISMNAFLKSIQPEMNDIFLFSLAFVNMVATLHFSQLVTLSWWRIVAAIIWTVVTYNLLLFACWLFLCGALRWPVLSILGKSALAWLRWFVLTNIGSLIRSDWLRLLQCYPLFISSLLTFGRLASLKLPRPSGDSWWEMECLFRPPIEPIDLNLEFEEGVLIERMANPSLWLTPNPSHYYISELKVWKFIKKVKKNSPEAIVTLMDGNSDDIVKTLCRGDLQIKIETTQCAICLDKYRTNVSICGLPCGHNYHHECIIIWLQRGNHHCPICRWPAYKPKVN